MTIAQQTTNQGVNSGTQGIHNSFYGYKAGETTTSNQNTFVGSLAGAWNTTGSNNSFLGYNAGTKNTTGSFNMFIGSYAGFHNSSGTKNSFIGYQAGAGNTIGTSNLFLGYFSGYGNKNGDNNTFIGAYSGKENVSGEDNIFIGTYAGFSNTNTSKNIYIGKDSGRNNETGFNNTFIGNGAGRLNVNGINNLFLGGDAGEESTGSDNVFIGIGAGLENGGSGNIFIGNSAGQSAQGDDKLYIDNSNAITPLIYGDFATDQLGINTNTIPDGYNFAVGGSASISEHVDTKTLTVGATETANDNWRPFTIGREVEPGRRNFNFVVSPNSEGEEYLSFGIADKRKVGRHWTAIYDKQTTFRYKDANDNEIFGVSHIDQNDEDLTFLHMPKPNSKVIIGDYAGYLSDQGHKLVVKEGTAMIEDGIFTNGRIAIGTTEADGDYKLTVKGKIHVQEVKVDLLGPLSVPDYVFKDDYDLKTLDQVEGYINEEGHLPNIPSAEEMVKEGMNLKEMNLKLLEKIEELTLYTIAQEKAIKEQKEANNKLEERLQKIEALLKK